MFPHGLHGPTFLVRAELSPPGEKPLGQRDQNVLCSKRQRKRKQKAGEGAGKQRRRREGGTRGPADVPGERAGPRGPCPHADGGPRRIRRPSLPRRLLAERHVGRLAHRLSGRGRSRSLPVCPTSRYSSSLPPLPAPFRCRPSFALTISFFLFVAAFLLFLPLPHRLPLLHLRLCLLVIFLFPTRGK